MLVDCPDCSRSVSDRAAVCPECACPIREHFAEAAAAAARRAERATRRRVGRTDCRRCLARSFYTEMFIDSDGAEKEGCTWCELCDDGRVQLCHSSRGYWAVAASDLEAFLAGEIDETKETAIVLGPKFPPARYANSIQPGDDPED